MKAKREKPLGLDMGFDEALRRFVGTDPTELPPTAILAGKKEKPPKRPPPVGEKKKAEPLD